MLLVIKEDIKCLTSANIVAADGSSQISNDAFMAKRLSISGLGGAKVNHNAVFSIFGLHQKILLYPHTEAFDIYRTYKNSVYGNRDCVKIR